MPKHWRPISLLNVDYKIATRSVAGRLLRLIASVVSPDQTCGVPGRSISENLTTLRDLVSYAEMENIPVALLSLDQEKAFDRVDWAFLSRTLETMGFGPGFRQWVRLFYCNAESAVVVNGWTSPSFSPSRRVRQSCPLSPLLYVLVVEVLAANIRTSPNIVGVTLPGTFEELRSSGYADDTTVAVTTEVSITEVFSIYDLYERGSGAKLNRGKSKGLWIGAWKDRQDSPHGLEWVKKLPILGGVISPEECSKEIWTPRLEKVKKRLAAWKGDLSYQGKSLIINALALSQIWHLCSVFVLPAWVATRLDKAIWSFFWSGKRDLVARRVVVQPKIAGGFEVVDLRLKANALVLQWARRFRRKPLLDLHFVRVTGRSLDNCLSFPSSRSFPQMCHRGLAEIWRRCDRRSVHRPACLHLHAPRSRVDNLVHLSGGPPHAAFTSSLRVQVSTALWHSLLERDVETNS